MVAMAAVAAATLAACSHSPLQQSVLPSQPNAQYSNALSAPGMMTQEELRVMASPRFRACPAASRGYATCYAILSTASISPDLSPNGSSCLHSPGCYVASDLQAAYGMTSAAQTRGKGVTVAVVDAFGYKGGYKGAVKDLAAYRRLAGLSACGKGCFKIVNQTGGTRLPKPGTGQNAGWQAEEMLDVDMVSAICPKCNILLVQANSSNNTDLGAGETTALKMAAVVSNSWGGAEEFQTLALFDTHRGKVITASAGDDGAGAPVSQGGNSPEAQPCGFTGVVCVGGTSLLVNNGVYAGEKVWQDFRYKSNSGVNNYGATGSGCSAMVAKPSWQKDKGCKKRSATDISANGDPVTGVVIACTPCAQAYGFTPPYLAGVGGTSESSPLIAAMYALAGNAGSIGSAPQKIWTSSKSNFHDVTQGFNDSARLNPPLQSGDTRTGLVCKKSFAYICKAAPGYDGPSGWGSPKGLGAL
jgi:subtilase family serine protease